MSKKDKCRKTQKGRIVVSKGEMECRIWPEQLDSYLKDGFKKGVKKSHSENIKTKFKEGEISLNKCRIMSEDEKKRISDKLKRLWKDGKVKGFTDGHHSEETKNHLSEIGSGKNNSQYGIKWTEERKAKAKETTCKYKRVKKYMNSRSEDDINDWLTAVEKTKKKNCTFNTSKPENVLYNQLLTVDNHTKRNYKCNLYPFRCDFYIPSLNLFIELNLHWSHGGKPYDPNDEECQKQLLKWQEKAKTSQFYQNAIETWTVRDVKKLETAKKNNLNYKVIYLEEEIQKELYNIIQE